MVYEKRCLSARNSQFSTKQKRPPVSQFTSSKYNFFKSFDDTENQASLIQQTNPKFKQDNLQLELQSFALFLDEDEMRQKQQLSPVMSNLKSESKKGSGTHHHLNHYDIIPDSSEVIVKK